MSSLQAGWNLFANLWSKSPLYFVARIFYIFIMIKFQCVNTLRPRQNGGHFPDDIFKWIFLNENAWISINISLKFVPRGPNNNIPTLGQVMAWRRPGDKPLSEPMMVRLPTHICVTRPQWVNKSWVTWEVSIDSVNNLAPFKRTCHPCGH